MYSTSREGRSRSRRIGRRAGEASQELAHGLLKSELDHAGLMTAVTGSIANAMAEGRACTLGFDALTLYLPRPADLTRELALAGRQVELDHELIGALGSLKTHLLFAIDLARAVVQAAGNAQCEIEPVADAWRRLAGISYVVSLLMDGAAGRSFPARTAGGPVGIPQLLKSVSLGGSPCLDAQGLIAVPQWAERRGGRRTALVLDVEARLLGEWQWARITDASPMGIGLSQLAGAAVGDAVVVAHDGEPIIEGTVVWTRGDAVGVRSLRPVDIGDLVARAGRDAKADSLAHTM